MVELLSLKAHANTVELRFIDRSKGINATGYNWDKAISVMGGGRTLDLVAQAFNNALTEFAKLGVTDDAHERIKALIRLEQFAKLHKMNAADIYEAIEHMILSELQLPTQRHVDYPDRFNELKKQAEES